MKNLYILFSFILATSCLLAQNKDTKKAISKRNQDIQLLSEKYQDLVLQSGADENSTFFPLYRSN